MNRTLILAATVCLAACGADSTVPELPVVDRIDIDPGAITLNVFEQSSLVASVFDGDGVLMSGADISWSSSDMTVLNVSGAVIEGLSPGQATVTATAQGESASCLVTVEVGMISFEVMPDRSAPCDRCRLSNQFDPWGVHFSFFSDADLGADTTATLARAGGFFPGDSANNHVVTGAMPPGGGTWVGVIVVAFKSSPDSVRFQLQGPHSVGDFPVRAYGASGALLSESAWSIESSVIATSNAGFDFRRDVFKVVAAEGISRIELDGRNKSSGSARGGFGLNLDDVQYWPSD